MAHRYAYDTSANALLRPAQGAVFFEDWDRARDGRDHDLLCAEMARLAYAPEDVVREALPRAGFSLGAWLGGAGTRGTEGFVATSADPPLTIVAFRGTEPDKVEDLIADATTLQADWPDGARQGARVHAGFLRAFTSVRGQLEHALGDVRQPLAITGHSLGAALATLAAAAAQDRHPALITFGSPRVGDGTFARLLRGLDIHRFVDCCDVVTRVPPERFDAPSIGTLIEELTGHALAAHAVAAVIAAALRAVGLSATFAHVGAARYANRHGVIADPITDDARATDQELARTAYGGGRHLSLAAVERAVETALAGARDRAVVLEVLRGVVRNAVGALGAGRVPLRDLADHAPINYVSILSGRA